MRSSSPPLTHQQLVALAAEAGVNVESICKRLLRVPLRVRHAEKRADEVLQRHGLLRQRAEHAT